MQLLARHARLPLRERNVRPADGKQCAAPVGRTASLPRTPASLHHLPVQPQSSSWVLPGRSRMSPVMSASAGALGGAGDADRNKQSAAMSSMDITSYPDNFVQKRLLVFVGIVVCYMGLYFTRGSLTYTAPVMVADPHLGFTLKDIGAMTSAFPLAYGISKFVGGVLGARISPTLMLAGGLLVTACINLGLTLPGVGLTLMTGLWALNGCLQGIGAPASAQLLTRWFASRERGTYWGLWNIGANLGGFMTPVLVGYLAKNYGWQTGMLVPGCIGVALALFGFMAIRDSPEDAGFVPVEEAGGKDKPKPDIWLALKHVLAEKGVWLLAFTYFFVYVVRQGATSWLVFYLLQAKGAPDAAAAARLVSGLELGGLVGGTLSGFVSDYRLRQAMDTKKEGVGYVGLRVQAYVLATFGVLVALRAVPAEAKLLQWACIASLGFCIYGPQMLIGLCGAELVEKTAVGASQGVLGLISYMGAANAGVPLSHILTTYGWDGYFAAMGVATAMSLLLLLPLANAKSYVQRAKAATAA